MVEEVVAHWTSTEKSICLWGKFKILKHAQLFYLRNSKKALVDLIKQILLRKEYSLR